MRKIILILFLLTLPMAANAAELPEEPPGDYREALDLVNKELEDVAYPDYFQEQNEAGRQFNENLWENRELFVYGEPHGDFDQGNNRYLGYTMRHDEDFTNVKYPHDEWAGGNLEDRDWIKEPWRKDKVKNAFSIEKNKFDQNEEYRKEILPFIQEGFDQYYGAGTKGAGGEILHEGPRVYKNEDSKYHDEWHKYVHVIQPPTEYTWGMGKMFHETSDGNIYYITVPIAYIDNDLFDNDNLKAEITSAPDTAEKGDKVKVEGKVTSEYSGDINTKLVWEVDGEVKKEKEVTIGEKDTSFEFTMPDSKAEVALEVNPDRDMPEYETTFEDNRDTVEIGAGGDKDLAVEITDHSDDVRPGQSAQVKGNLTSTREEPVTTKIQWRIDGNIEHESEITFRKERELNYSLEMPEDDVPVTVEVNPDRDMPENEKDWSNNMDTAAINMAADPTPTVNSNLVLTAESQGGEDRHGNYQPPEEREQGTAKWGDTVTAQLNVDKNAPGGGRCYELETWELHSATIEFPEKHPDFAFGSPVEPVSTTTKSMNITGDDTATVQFKQDWSIAGADVHDRLKDQHVPGPTEYDVKVTYEMLWEYEEGDYECHTDCDWFG